MGSHMKTPKKSVWSENQSWKKEHSVSQHVWNVQNRLMAQSSLEWELGKW